MFVTKKKIGDSAETKVMDNFENYEKIDAGYETVMNTLSSLFSVAKIKCKDFLSV